jgi:hypothetical protein
MGLVSRQMRGVAEMVHLFARPLVMDSSASDAALGLEATPFDDAVRATVEAYLSDASQGARVRP